MRTPARPRRDLRRVLGLPFGGALVVALLPGAAVAQEPSDPPAPEVISTAEVCQPPYDHEFDDIAGSPHTDNILCMADHGLTEGLRDGVQYGPRQEVTRGQMASFIARFIEEYDSPAGESPLPVGNAERFDDVPASYAHADNINKLATIGVVEGTSASDGRSYAPNAEVTRGQMASFIRRALSYVDTGAVDPLSAPPAGTDRFGDDDGLRAHEANIDAIAGVGIVQGFADGTYRPLAPVLRDQMASFVMRSYAYAGANDLGEGTPSEGPPEFASSVPEHGATGVPVDTTIAATYTETFVTGTVELVCEGDDAPRAGETTMEERTITFTPADDLPFATDCAAAVQVTDVDDDASAVTTIGFTTAPQPDPDTGEIVGVVHEGVPATGFVAVAESAEVWIGDERIELGACPDGTPAADDGACITAAGWILEDGTVAIEPGALLFPVVETSVTVDDEDVPVAVAITAPEGAVGTADLGTGDVDLGVTLDVAIAVGDDTCTIDGVELALSTGDGAPVADDRGTLADDGFAVGEATGGELCDVLASELGLPSPAGDNVVSFDLLFEFAETLAPGDPIDGATVTVDGTELTATTDAEGAFAFPEVQVGTYELTVTADGYQTLTLPDVPVVADEPTAAIFLLVPDDVDDVDDALRQGQAEVEAIT